MSDYKRQPLGFKAKLVARARQIRKAQIVEKMEKILVELKGESK